MAMTFEEYAQKHLGTAGLSFSAMELVRMGWNARGSHGNCQGILDSSACEVPEGLYATQEEWARINGRKHIADDRKMVVNLKPIAESKVRQLGGDVCGVLVRKDGRLAAVDEHGRVMWLDSWGEAGRAQGGQGAEVVKPGDPLPCPFCGSTDVGGAGGTVGCYRCPAEIAVQNANTAYAVELWNNRVKTQPQPAVPEGWRECLTEMVQAMYDYEMSVEEDAPYKHRAMMDRAHALLSTPTTPQADGWKVKFMQIMSEIYSDLDDEHEDPIPSDLWDLWRDLRAATQPPAGQEGSGDE